jgi:hypothetical protein
MELTIPMPRASESASDAVALHRRTASVRAAIRLPVAQREGLVRHHATAPSLLAP